MSREWKPGTVLANENGEPMFVIEVTGNTVAAGKTGRAWIDGSHVVTPDGNGWRPDVFANLRPLVVIDPEDREQVERLLAHFLSIYDGMDAVPSSGEIASMTAAFREFANPTPPKPDEPLGLGAVVEDAEGRTWVRGDHGLIGWTHLTEWRGYADIAAVRVLSEGVQP